MSVKKEYAGNGVIVVWDSKYCIHSGNCLRSLPQVFDVNAHPWITADAASADDAAAAVQRCPSGALSYRRTDGAPDEEPPSETMVYPIPDGPLFVNGRTTVTDERGDVVRSATRVTLCRCGASANKPFCDTSHRRIGFRSA